MAPEEVGRLSREPDQIRVQGHQPENLRMSRINVGAQTNHNRSHFTGGPLLRGKVSTTDRRSRPPADSYRRLAGHYARPCY